MDKARRTALKVFFQYKELLAGLGRETLTEDTMLNAEQVVCRIYNVPEVTTVDKARVTLFKRALRAELFPPTRDALRHHIKRVHLQTMVWLEAIKAKPSFPPASTMGWELRSGQMSPALSSLAPVPTSCLELVTCGCTTKCYSSRCKCKKSRLTCTSSCKCEADCMNAEI